MFLCHDVMSCIGLRMWVGMREESHDTHGLLRWDMMHAYMDGYMGEDESRGG